MQEKICQYTYQHIQLYNGTHWIWRNMCAGQRDGLHTGRELAEWDIAGTPRALLDGQEVFTIL
jgi:hypothetical protein